MRDGAFGMMKFNLNILFYSVLFLCVFNATSFADYGGGSGTIEDPYLIYTAEQFNQIGLNIADWNKHFALMADINLIDIESYNIIGDYPSIPFTGVFDGRGHVIYNFNYYLSGFETGLFSYISGTNAQLKNLGLVEPQIDGGITTSFFVGVLEDGKIANCWVTSDTYLASLFGVRIVGGFAGENDGGVISNCYLQGYINASDSIAGGTVGSNSGTIEQCYFAGYMHSQYNNAGAIVGSDDGGTYTACFWDITQEPGITGVGNLEPDPNGVIAESTENMQTASTFINAGWALTSPDNILEVYDWRLCEDGSSYPRLAAQLYRGDFDCPDGVDETDLAVLAQDWLYAEFEVNVDFHQDNFIDFRDFSILANAWQTTQSDPNWNPAVDIAGPYGEIDELDLNLFFDYWLAEGKSKLKADIEPYGGDGFVDFYDFAHLADDWLKVY